MRNRGKFAAEGVALAIALILMLPAIGQTQSKTVYRARFSYHWFPTHGCAIASEKFAKMVREKTHGQVQITTFGSGQLYSLQQIVTALSTGAVELGGVVDTSFVAVDPNIGIGELPYYWNGFNQIRKLWEDTPAGRKHWNALQKKLNIKILAYIPTGPVTTFSTKTVLDTPAKFHGLKVRYLSRTEIPVYKALGGTPVFVQTTEIYTALQTGLVDVVPTVFNAIKAYHWWDYLKFGDKPFMYYWDSYIVANATWWNHLPKNLQDIITKEVCVPLSRQATENVMTGADRIIQEWGKGHGGKIVILTKAEEDAFKEVFRKNVWPAQIKGMDPAVIAAAEKLTGIPIK